MKIRKITWKWYNDTLSIDTIINDKIFLCSGSWDEFMFSIQGLGLSKAERELFNTKFLDLKDHMTIYFLKWYVTYDTRGYKEHYRNVDIIENMVMYDTSELLNKFKHSIVNKYNSIINKIKFRQQYEFGMDRYWEGDYKFTSDMLSAFQLASNYEADLYLNGKLILSPLGLEYSQNVKLIQKYLGKGYVNKKGFNLRGYKNPYDKEIKNFTMLARN